MADANKANLGIALYATLNNTFNAAMKVAEPVTMPLYQKQNSGSEIEIYNWEDFIIGFKRWEKGQQRVYRDVKSMEFSVKNEKWEASIEIDVDKINDNQAGQYDNKASALGTRAKLLPDELIYQLLTGGFTTTKVYDGQPWFGTHSILGTTVVNAGTAVFDATSFLAAIKVMNSWKVKADDLSTAVPLNMNAKYVLVHGPNLIGSVKDVLEVELISGGASNKWQGAATPLQFNFIEDDSWYLFNVNAPVKPIILQEREAMTFKTFNADGSIELFNRDAWACGGKWRGTVLASLPWLGYGSTGTGAS